MLIRPMPAQGSECGCALCRNSVQPLMFLGSSTTFVVYLRILGISFASEKSLVAISACMGEETSSPQKDEVHDELISIS